MGDVHASQRAELASGARIQGTLYYGLLEMDEGAEVNGQLVHIDGARQSQLRLEHQLTSGEGSQDGPPPTSAADVGTEAPAINSDQSHT